MVGRMYDEKVWSSWCKRDPPEQQQPRSQYPLYRREHDHNDQAHTELFGGPRSRDQAPGRAGRRLSDLHASPTGGAPPEPLPRVESQLHPKQRYEEFQSAGIGAPAVHGRRRNPEIGAYFDGTVVNMLKNYEEMTQRAAGLQERVSGGVASQVVYVGQRDKSDDYAPPLRHHSTDPELFPTFPVASHPKDSASAVKEAHYGRPRTDIRPGGPGWSDEHLSPEMENPRPGFGRRVILAAHKEYVHKQDASYRPPPEPDRNWKHGEPPAHQFDFDARGRPLLFPHHDTDVTITKREPKNYSVNGHDDEMHAPRWTTDATDAAAHERRRQSTVQGRQPWDSVTAAPRLPRSQSPGQRWDASQDQSQGRVDAVKDPSPVMHRPLPRRATGMAPQLTF